MFRRMTQHMRRLLYAPASDSNYPASLLTSFDFVTSNVYEDMEKIDESYTTAGVYPDDASIDCMFWGALSWGHSVHQWDHRRCLVKEKVDILNDRVSDWDIRVSEYALRLTPRQLWLPDKDGDSHSALIVTIRPKSLQSSVRKRSAQGKEKRQKKWQEIQDRWNANNSWSSRQWTGAASSSQWNTRSEATAWYQGDTWHRERHYGWQQQQSQTSRDEWNPSSSSSWTWESWNHR